MRKGSLRLKDLFSHVPIYRQLVKSSKHSFAAAAKELTVTTLFSLFPIWFYPLMLFIGGVPAWQTLKSFVVQGELYLISAALLGPVVYATTETYGRSDADPGSNELASEPAGFPRVRSLQFPYGRSFFVAAIVVGCAAAFLFPIVRDSTHSLFGIGPIASQLGWPR